MMKEVDLLKVLHPSLVEERRRRYTCCHCNKEGHNIRRCPERQRLGIQDENLLDKIRAIPRVYKVLVKPAVRARVPRLIYEVYMDTTEMQKNPNSEMFKELQRDDISVIHAFGFITTLDQSGTIGIFVENV